MSLDDVSDGRPTVDVTAPLAAASEYAIQREKRGPWGSYANKLLSDGASPLLVAYTRSSLFSTKYSVVAPSTGTPHAMVESDPKGLRYAVTGAHCALAVEYQGNFLGLAGCRSFRVTCADGRRLVSKPPLLIHGGYYLDFHGMDTAESVKNFICVDPQDQTKEFCLLTRNRRGTFTLRVKPPFSPLCAFALALTAFHTGIYHR
jgi:hypothetical protein